MKITKFSLFLKNNLVYKQDNCNNAEDADMQSIFNFKKDEKEYISNTEAQKEYNEKKQLWTWTTILCAVFPFIIPIISSIFNHSFDFVNIINNGDIILLMYSIIIPTFIDLLKVKNKSSSQYIIWAIIFIIVIFSDLYCYSVIKNPYQYIDANNKVVTYDNTIRNIAITAILVISSLTVCNKILKIIYDCNVNEEEDKSSLVRKEEEINE